MKCKQTGTWLRFRLIRQSIYHHTSPGIVCSNRILLNLTKYLQTNKSTLLYKMQLFIKCLAYRCLLMSQASSFGTWTFQEWFKYKLITLWHSGNCLTTSPRSHIELKHIHRSSPVFRKGWIAARKIGNVKLVLLNLRVKWRMKNTALGQRWFTLNKRKDLYCLLLQSSRTHIQMRFLQVDL